MKPMTLFLSLVLPVVLLFQPGVAVAEEAPSSMADLMVTPKRLVLEGTERTAELALMNRSNKQLTYAVSFIEYRMTEDGKLETITEEGRPGEHFCSPFVRFTPRRVILEPHQTQMLRVLVRKPQNLPEGEYRSHLAFKVVPGTTEATAPGAAGGKGIQIKLIPIYGLSIPVIVRNGSLSCTNRLEQLRYNGASSNKTLSVSLVREGTSSCYGDFEVVWKPASGKESVVGRLNGVAVYASNATRTVNIPLSFPEGVASPRGELHVRFVDREGGVESLKAENSLILP